MEGEGHREEGERGKISPIEVASREEKADTRTWVAVSLCREGKRQRMEHLCQDTANRRTLTKELDGRVSKMQQKHVRIYNGKSGAWSMEIASRCRVKRLKMCS